MRKLFFIAGEASGDLHASALIRALQQREPDLQCLGLGGDLMAEAGCQLLQHYREMAFMGFVAVLKNMDKVKRNFQIAQEALLRERPDMLILIDYPSFNLRMAEFCKKHLPHTKIIYYIPPKVWAWKSWRIHKICQLSDHVLGIFPFEPDYFAARGYECTYVGNPTVDSVLQYVRCSLPQAQTVCDSWNHPRQHAIAILPGSRRSEIAHCLPKMIEAAQQVSRQAELQGLPPYEIWIAGAPGVESTFYHQFAGTIPVRFGETYRLLTDAKAAIVNSGTATLEAALLGCPQVPVYHIACDWIAHLRPILFASPFFTLPNIIMQREVIRERIANKFRVPLVADELNRLLHDEAYRQQQIQDYQEIAVRIGSQLAPDTAADIIL